MMLMIMLVAVWVKMLIALSLFILTVIWLVRVCSVM